MSNGTVFDVDDGNTLAFQDFGSTRIASDMPSGRISPLGATSTSRGGPAADLYAPDRAMASTINNAAKGGMFAIDSYTGYFDVDTWTVLTRCYKTLLPREDYIGEILSGVPDLYGPFWVPTTLVFSLFLTSSLTSSVNAYLGGEAYAYDFTRLGAATTLVYVYSFGMPLLVWAALKYWAGVHERSSVEVISLYGYSAFVWIISSWLTLVPFGLFQLVIVFAGAGLSLAFLIRNLYPTISTSDNASARLLVLIITGFHLVFAIALWWGFLAGGGSGAITNDKDLPASDDTTTGESLVKRLFQQ